MCLIVVVPKQRQGGKNMNPFTATFQKSKQVHQNQLNHQMNFQAPDMFNQYTQSQMHFQNQMQPDMNYGPSYGYMGQHPAQFSGYSNSHMTMGMHSQMMPQDMSFGYPNYQMNMHQQPMGA